MRFTDVPNSFIFELKYLSKAERKKMTAPTYQKYLEAAEKQLADYKDTPYFRALPHLKAHLIVYIGDTSQYVKEV